ncbi:hypothetical protein NL676_009784 [Syzygium grande]|nr:hypothetical protein NL676_009784 [Syzygium grande]
MEPPISRAPPPLPPSPTTTKTLAATATSKTTIAASRASSPATGLSRKAFRLGKFGQVLNHGQLLHHQLLLPQLPQLQLFLLSIDPPRRRDLDARLDARLVLPQPPQIPNFQIHAPNVPDELRPRADLRQNTRALRWRRKSLSLVLVVAVAAGVLVVVGEGASGVELERSVVP